MVMGGLRSGQARIIEAVMASILIFIAFTAAFYMLFSSERFFRQEAVDLNRLAYNTLHRLVESGAIEEAVGGDNVNETKLRNAIQSLLPQNIYFKLTIYNLTIYGGNSGQQSRIEEISSISNAQQEVFERSSEVVSASITYTSRDRKIYYLCLSLTRAGLA